MADSIGVRATYHKATDKTNAAINVEAHPATFKKIWADICADGLTCSAVKYLHEPRRVNGFYLITAPEDCEDALRSVFTLGFGG
jgi:hypothetical protein